MLRRFVVVSCTCWQDQAERGWRERGPTPVAMRIMREAVGAFRLACNIALVSLTQVNVFSSRNLGISLL